MCDRIYWLNDTHNKQFWQVTAGYIGCRYTVGCEMALGYIFNSFIPFSLLAYVTCPRIWTLLLSFIKFTIYPRLLYKLLCNAFFVSAILACRFIAVAVPFLIFACSLSVFLFFCAAVKLSIEIAEELWLICPESVNYIFRTSPRLISWQCLFSESLQIIKEVIFYIAGTRIATSGNITTCMKRFYKSLFQ